VGYTNAGKSSLFTRLTRASVVVEDRLFATLDPRARRMSLGDDVVAVMTDTVGFIRKLPHHLVAPFRSTLEETADADIVLHVVDAAHANWEEHLEVGDEVLTDLGVERDRVLVVLNKIDLLSPKASVRVPMGRAGCAVSAITGEGLDDLRDVARHTLLSSPDVSFLRVPLERADDVAKAVNLPHQLARRFDERSLELAMRVNDARLSQIGLDEYLVSSWGESERGA
jgi:GTP-binding protein HflX